MMKPLLGLRAHDFGTLPAEALAPSIADSGAACVQLALAKALPNEPMLPSDLGESGLAFVSNAFKESELSVVVLGCYIDMVTLNMSEREAALQRFEAHIEAAPKLGCKIVGTETGSPVPYGTGPDAIEAAFRVSLHSLRRLITVAEKSGPNGVKVGLEPVADIHALSSAEHARILIEEMNSDALGIIFDPVNLVPQKGIADMEAFLDNCFDCFGEHIVALHAKDYRMESGPNGPEKSGPIPAGTGEMDWLGVFTRLFKAGKQGVPILLEDTGPADAEDTFACLTKLWLQAASAEADRV
ncbi:sugar phosphate isomerase/epimerase family protein [Teredinibacter franksiae]|uniref:sugar phosphate isomerase/epimerase family protein n=1 Tax=Teredinibacter franksiae TaxID=2761453 RepID=UPI00162A0603|nr:sugar phosphate isomerase/epimerase family protein [Teredinibacter franksiae]